MYKKEFSLIIFDLDGTLDPKSDKIIEAFQTGAAKIISRKENIGLEKAIKVLEKKKRKIANNSLL